MKTMLILTGLFNIMDYFFTRKAIAAGMVESNPAMNAILHTPIFPLYKLIIVTGFIIFVWYSRKWWKGLRPLITAGVWLVFLAYSCVTVWHCVLWVRGYV